MADASREEGGQEGKGSPSTLFGFSLKLESYSHWNDSNEHRHPTNPKQDAKPHLQLKLHTPLHTGHCSLSPRRTRVRQTPQAPTSIKPARSTKGKGDLWREKPKADSHHPKPPTASLILQHRTHKPRLYTLGASVDESAAELRPQHQSYRCQVRKGQIGAKEQEESKGIKLPTVTRPEDDRRSLKSDNETIGGDNETISLETFFWFVFLESHRRRNEKSTYPIRRIFFKGSAISFFYSIKPLCGDTFLPSFPLGFKDHAKSFRSLISMQFLIHVA
ncbi:Uncharacterized protein Rs2_28913 [Raphanus sativus]|nr:Uncharacterized protein Rs2_28913 [Raphanus sativus]